MGLSTAVRWWDEWQLSVLVLVSLSIQYFLSFFAGGRKFHIPSWYRFLIWVSFLGSDFVAIYALATLFSQQKKMNYSTSYDRRDLQLLWSPILLIHFGGQLSITAYNLEDNQLWKRYIVTAPSQVAVAIFVFYKTWSWSADKKLSAAAMLLFIYGIFKCFLKPWALRSASFNRLASSFKSPERTTVTSREEELGTYVQEVRTFVQQADNDPPPAINHEGFSKPSWLFLDYANPYSTRLLDLKYFWMLDQKAAYKSIKGDLSKVFDLFYTRVREDEALNWRTACNSSLSLIVGVALFLFHKGDKKAYMGSDITVTYVLLWGTFVLELTSSLLAVHIKKLTSVIFDFPVFQQSIVAWVHLNSVETCYSCEDITNLVCQHAKDGWKNFIKDAESYRNFNDLRGQWTLKREGCSQDLLWSLERPFTESILIWHIATDFCFHMRRTSDDSDCARRSTEISYYLMHLFCSKITMLIPGGTSQLLAAARRELEDKIFKDEEIPRDITACTRKIINRLEQRVEDVEGVGDRLEQRVEDVEGVGDRLEQRVEDVRETFMFDAFRLFSCLTGVGDEEKMWKVIRGVWVEMLCFSASRGQGYMHAKVLGSGGEYLSIVWLLWARAGMETFQDRLHRTRKPQDRSSRKRKPQGTEIHKVQENAACPSAYYEDTEVRKEE